MTEPGIGDWLVTRTYGNWRDRFVSWAIRYGTNSHFNHAAVYVGAGQIVEARPHGAGTAPWDSYSGCRWSTGSPIAESLTSEQRTEIAAAALQMVGTPYGFADILAIALAQRRLHRIVDVHKALNRQPWWVKRIVNQHTLICSQAVDSAYAAAGVQLFDDGRLPSLVSPGDLGDLLGAT